MHEFVAWPKTPRLFRECVITEKIDGTNAAIGITEDGAIYAQSRKRIITPDSDNFDFARWVADNAGALSDVLGVGLHFGEWWGHGIQRGYGCVPGERYFSLFNTARWGDLEPDLVEGLRVVPVYKPGETIVFDTHIIEAALAGLRFGSLAKPGFMKPEGIVVFHKAAQQTFKVLIDNDELPKGLAA